MTRKGKIAGVVMKLHAIAIVALLADMAFAEMVLNVGS